MIKTKGISKATSGQSIVEFAMVLPLLLLLVLGVTEVGYALYEDHLITKLAREGSNLISRQTTLADAETAVRSAATAPISFNGDGRLIFSVITKGTAGAGANSNIPIISQRLVAGTLSASSILGDPPASSYGTAPNYSALNPNNDINIRVSGPLPNGLVLADGQFIYVTEVYTKHDFFTPFLSFFKYTLPSNLYASAYF